MLKKTGEIERRFMFDFTELTAIAEYLEKQEEKGFRLKEIRGRKFIFEECEPQTIRYTADIYKGSFVEDFVDSCNKEGWEFVDTYDYLYVFRTEKEDAIDIVTDEGDKYKAVRARAFLNPKYLVPYLIIILELVLRLLYSIPESYSYYVDLPESDIYWWIGVLSVAFMIGTVPFHYLDIFIWLHDAKKSLKKGDKVRYYNFEEVKKKQQIMVIVSFSLTTVIMMIISFIDSGYVTDRTLYWLPWFVCTVLNLCVFNFAVFKVQDKNKKQKQTIIAIILFVILFTEPFAVVAYNERKTPTEYEKAPITFEDFGYDDLYYEDNSIIDGTRFAQCYKCSVISKEEMPTDNFTSILDYEIFVSDSPRIRQKYIDNIFKTYEELEWDITMITVFDSKWDTFYKRVFEEDMDCFDGIAVKGNTVIYTCLPVRTDGQDFFEVAYEKLFPETE